MSPGRCCRAGDATVQNPSTHGCPELWAWGPGQVVAAGSLMVNVAPVPGPSLAAVRVPPWPAMMPRAMVRPRPLPLPS